MIAAMMTLALGGLVFAGGYFLIMYRNSQPTTVSMLSGRPIQPS